MNYLNNKAVAAVAVPLALLASSFNEKADAATMFTTIGSISNSAGRLTVSTETIIDDTVAPSSNGVFTMQYEGSPLVAGDAVYSASMTLFFEYSDNTTETITLTPNYVSVIADDMSGGGFGGGGSDLIGILYANMQPNGLDITESELALWGGPNVFNLGEYFVPENGFNNPAWTDNIAFLTVAGSPSSTLTYTMESFEISNIAIPEPSSAALGLSAAALVLLRRQRPVTEKNPDPEAEAPLTPSL
jgi:hypothetical protein